MKTKRLNNVELLRILSMLMVLTLHYLSFGGFLPKYTTFSFSSMAIWFFESLSFVAVNCYVLISGYFLIKSKFKLEKLFQLCLEVLFYSIFIYAIMIIFGKVNFSISSFAKSFLPVFLGNYWFVTCYVMLYVLSPFINKLILNLSKEEYKKLIGIILLAFSVWATFIPNNHTINYGGSYSISWFICLYLISGYIRLHLDLDSVNKYICLGLYLFCSLINTVTYFLIPTTNYIRNDFLYNYYSITMVIGAVSLFLYFLKFKINSDILNKVISFVSPTTFGIYLIHENPNIRNFLWSTFNISALKISGGGVLIINIIFTPILLFICFCLIDKLREVIFNLFYKTSIYRKIKIKLGSVEYEKS